jgi:protoporphyrinogen oxidase
MSDPGRIVILGAGPCGLGAAFRLREIGYGNFDVFEREPFAGGLAASVEDEDGFVWDYGCHVLYSRSDYFNRVMEGLPGTWIEQPRDAQVWMNRRFVPYPLQYNVHRLPLEQRRDCVLGLARAATRAEPAREDNFHDWIVGAFGDGIAQHFMLPYNRKVWAHPLESMGVSWIAERVPRPDLTRVLANLLEEKDDDGWGPNARFRYPTRGGTGAIWRSIADAIGPGRNHFGRAVSRIDAERRRLHLDDGADEPFDTLISTLPIDRLVRLAGIDELRPAAAQLSSSVVNVVGIGLKGKLPDTLRERKWIYFPDARLPFYRATVLSNFAPSNAPAGHWSLLAEVAHSKHRSSPGQDIVDQVVAAFRSEGLIPADAAIVSRFHHVAAPGYPTPTLSRDAALAEIHPVLEKLGIYSRGRFGAWRYEIANQDHCFLQGAELAGRLVRGESEPTFTS